MTDQTGNFIFLYIMAAILVVVILLMSINFHGAGAFLQTTEAATASDKFGFFMKTY